MTAPSTTPVARCQRPLLARKCIVPSPGIKRQTKNATPNACGRQIMSFDAAACRVGNTRDSVCHAARNTRGECGPGSPWDFDGRLYIVYNLQTDSQKGAGTMRFSYRRTYRGPMEAVV